MKRLISILVIVLLSSTFLMAQKTEILFNLKFGMIKGGEAKLTITDTIYNGIPAKSYYFKGETTGLTDKIFAVKDIYHTIIDAETYLPLKSVRDAKEKTYKSYNEVTYFHENDSIYSLKSGGRKVPKNLVDILSVFFYAINKDCIHKLGQGTRIVYSSLNGDDIGPIAIRYMGDEKIKTKLGKFDTYVLLPTVEKGKVLMSSDGLTMNVHKKYLVPVKMEFELLLGSLKAEIVDYKIDNKHINLE